ncbi:MAG: PSD1 and planctomycete cytochrome C domain-containing protein [Planctomycetia bacterium]|nr:PSD1 and planctomycete cytochrome C domain-containing protein [Planctomycetia bacterium]
MNRSLPACDATGARTISIVLLSIVCSTPLYAAETAPTNASPAGIEFFERKIRPIFVERCYGCHSTESKKAEGGLLLDSREAILKGGDSGPALVAGDPEKSLLIIAVRQTDKDLKMPPEDKLPAVQLADLGAWVKMGAPDPRLASTAKGSAIASRPKFGMSLEEGRQFWSFRPVQDSKPPQVKNTAWSQTSLDPFILARLEQANVAPAPDADKRTLLRRVTFDLTGLPPTPAEMEAFLADNSSRAFETVVDRLLASPRYGERWGRHWLDVVRYADTCGNASDYPVPQAHKYRDWVIEAFNRDLPYDQFLREQLAGDLLASKTDAERYQRITATGYLAIARRFGGDRTGEHHLTLEDTIDNLGRAVLGSSIACARCHDHKFDPFTMSDYYGLYGIFNSTRYPFPGAEVSRMQADFVPLMPAQEVEALLKPHREKLAKVDAEIKRLEAAVVEAKKAPEVSDKEKADKKKSVAAANAAVAEAKKQRTTVLTETPLVNNAYAVAEGEPANAKIQLRGDPKRLGDETPRHFPAVLGNQTLAEKVPTSGRLQLAEWISDRTNPLTARVMVNRIWQHHFGKGIVQTPNDFGKQGKAPTHPELLDFLAARFVEGGWSIKSMHKLILLSHAWQLSSGDIASGIKQDPTNELFWKQTRHRIDAEGIRDTLLFVSGDLDESRGGAHPFPLAHTWNWSQHKPFTGDYPTRHRSVYLMQQRLRKNRYLALFDGADPSISTGVRLPSTTPLQALFVMNDPLAHTAAEKFAGRLLAATQDEHGRLSMAFQVALTRDPTSDEERECRDFLQQYREKLTALKTPPAQLEQQTWSAFARAFLSSNELIFVD